NIFFSARVMEAGNYVLQITAGKIEGRSGRYRISNIEIRDFQTDDDELLAADADYSRFRRQGAVAAQNPALKLDLAADVYRRRKQTEFQGWTLLLAGQYHTRLSDYRAAAERYSASAAAFASAGNDFGRAHALDFLADMSSVLRDYPRAIEIAT